MVGFYNVLFPVVSLSLYMIFWLLIHQRKNGIREFMTDRLRISRPWQRRAYLSLLWAWSAFSISASPLQVVLSILEDYITYL